MQAAAMVGPLKQASLSLSTTFAAFCIHLSLLFLCSGASALMLLPVPGLAGLLPSFIRVGNVEACISHSGGLRLVSMCLCVSMIPALQRKSSSGQ